MSTSTAARVLAVAAVAVSVGVAAVGCSRPLARARLSALEPPAPEELDAAARVGRARCSSYLGLLFPGLGQLCLGEPGKAAVLAGLAAAEIGTAVAVKRETGRSEHPGVVLPLVALQDLWVYGLADGAITRDLAASKPFAPRDSLVDLAAAPFNWQVMRQPAVWGGLAGFLALGIGVSWLLDDPDTSRAGDDPELFGKTIDGRVGYPLGFGLGGGLFTHVAIAEEALFRGTLQSSFARSAGERDGWLGATLLFGAAHVPNAFLLPAGQRQDYLLYGLPIITAAGGYLGWLYRRTDYGLASPVALHFWYDLLLTATFFVIDPESSPFQAGVTVPL